MGCSHHGLQFEYTEIIEVQYRMCPWSEQKFTTQCHVGVGNSLIEYTMLGLSIDWESLFILIVLTSTTYCGVSSSYRSFFIDHFVNHFTGTEF